jgi:hypothetical protein
VSLFHDAAVRCRAARDVIAQRGWMQGNYGYCDGPVCLVGAMRLACGAAHPHGSVSMAGGWVVFGAIHGALQAVTDAKDIVAWNDASTRKREDVLAALDRAAQYLESRACARTCDS